MMAASRYLPPRGLHRLIAAWLCGAGGLVHVQTFAMSAEPVPLAQEHPCFRIDDIRLEVPHALQPPDRRWGEASLPQDPFAFAQGWLDRYRGVCAGKQGVEQLVRGVSGLILEHGYVTSRVLVPPQQLSEGKLRLTLLPGVIGEVRMHDGGAPWMLATAFPSGHGDLMRLHDLEQGLEQMQQTGGQQAQMEIRPTSAPGVSDVVVTVARDKPWSLYASFDNAGSRGTGQYQMQLGLTANAPFRLNDRLSLTHSRTLPLRDRQRGVQGWHGAWTLPWGYWTASVAASRNDHFQRVAGIAQSFLFSGRSASLDLMLHRRLPHSGNDTAGVHWRLSRRFANSYIEDVEITAQRRNNTVAEFGASLQRRAAAGQVEATVAYRQGLGGLGAQADVLAAAGGPTWRFHMAVADVQWVWPLRWGDQPLGMTTALRGQFTNHRLYGIDGLAIGGRSSVRGFDGEVGLIGDSGFHWRNAMQLPLAASGQAFYAALDYGRVYGPSTTGQPGASLAGGGAGWQGGIGTRHGAVSYDLFVGMPLYKPTSLHTARVHGEFRVRYQY